MAMASDMLVAPRARAWSRATLGTLELGYVPLTDAAPLLVADELGFFARHGVAVRLNRAAGWAALRDRVAFGGCDGAQILSPLPIAMALGYAAPAPERLARRYPTKAAIVAPTSRSTSSWVMPSRFLRSAVIARE